MRRPIFTGSKSIYVKANALVQEPNMFDDMIRIEDVPMEPNENGLFTIDQVANLASKRGCNTYPVDDYACEVRRGKKSVRVMVTDRGLWSPVNIFRECREANGQPHYEVNQATAKIKNPGNLDEVRIAEIIGADGVRPYLSQPSQYAVDGVVTNVRRPFMDPEAGAGFGWSNKELGLSRAQAGDWTWPMFCIMCSWVTRAAESYHYRRAVRALDAAGLLKLTTGPRGDFRTATFEWLPLAYLQPIERLAAEPKEVLDPVDADAMASLGA